VLSIVEQDSRFKNKHFGAAEQLTLFKDPVATANKLTSCDDVIVEVEIFDNALIMAVVDEEEENICAVGEFVGCQVGWAVG
jgi:hypothetical protein